MRSGRKLFGVAASKLQTKGLMRLKELSFQEKDEVSLDVRERLPLAFSSYQPIERGGPSGQVVISHGMLGSKNNWSTVAKGLVSKTKRTVIAVDARNHGESPHSKDFSYNHMAADLGGVLETLGIDRGGKKSVLMGHSLGGRTSMFCALNNPEKVESLIIVDISPMGKTPGLEEVRKLLRFMMKISFDSCKNLSEARSTADKQLMEKVKSQWFRLFLLTNVIQTGPIKFGWRLNLQSLFDNVDNIIYLPKAKMNTYEGPTLFIAGGKSDYITEDDHTIIKQLFPKSEIRTIPNASHMVHIEEPKKVVEAVSEFLEKSTGKK